MKSCWRAKGIIIICIRKIKAEACGCRHTAEDNKIKIAHALKVCTENTENPCLADFCSDPKKLDFYYATEFKICCVFFMQQN